MKYFRLVVLFLVLLLLAGCGSPSVLNRLPDYETGRFDSHESFQDSTDYGEYTFLEVTAWQLQLTGYFQPVTAEDVEILRAYVEDFEEWVALFQDCEDCGLAEFYSFSQELVEEGDYFSLVCGEIRDSFLGDYTIYYFDMDTQTLYYLRSNI